jgi:histone H1/5
MIKEAIMAEGKAEASTYAIAKRVGERHGEALPGNYRKVLAVQLRNFAAKGRLVRVKASFRLAPAEEKKTLASAKKRRGSGTATTKKAASKKAAPAPAAARPKRAKKAAKPKPKQPKSIRTGAARKANKASA